MMWVKKHAPTKNATEMCILYALADRANDDGTGCWPYYETLADEARCSVPTIKRHIKELEDRGLIIRGDQRKVSGYPRYRKPVVWDLDMSLRREPKKVGYQPDTSPERGINGDKVGYQPEQSEVSTTTEWGVTGDTYNLPTTTHTTVLQPSIDHPSADRFEEFWEVVPKKVGKQAAKKAWVKAIKATDPDVIIAGMKQYRDDPNRSDAFTKNPQGWLNDGRWEDDPLPARAESHPGKKANTVENWLGLPEGSLDGRNPFSSDPFADPYADHGVIDGTVIEQKELP